MNKKIRLIVVSIILLVMVGMNISYAISMKEVSSFFEVNEKELASGETLEMIIDLSKIDYEQFKLLLSSNVEIEKVYADENGVEDSDIKLDEESNDIVINIDKKKLDLNKIVLYYQIPENIEIGIKLQLNAQAIITEDNEEKIVEEKQIEITIVEKDDDNEDNKNQEDNKNENNKNEENKNFEENVNKEQQGNKSNEELSKNPNQIYIQNVQSSNSNKTVSFTNNMQGMTNSSSSDIAKTSTTQAETATYNGSSNNYLASLEIDGVQLTSEFNKEKSTYFSTVEELETITVTANAEDSNSKVAITGTKLKSGENKVLISVTAENGDVRYYRIYVTNN